MTFRCRFTQAEITAALDACEAGDDRNAICARLGISVRTLFRWQAKAERSRPSLLRLVAALHEENARLKQLVGGKDTDLSAN